MKLFFLVSCKVTDNWTKSAGLRGPEAQRWAEENVRTNLAEYAIRCLPANPTDPSGALVDVIDSPDHAHSVYILRSGWAPHAAPAFPVACGHCGATISTVEQAIGHRCGNPKSARSVAHGVCGIWGARDHYILCLRRFWWALRSVRCSAC